MKKKYEDDWENSADENEEAEAEFEDNFCIKAGTLFDLAYEPYQQDFH